MRAVCQRCLRPQVTCYCGELPPIPTRTRVVLLQHPRERRVAIGTARMAHLALPNSELHLGVEFSRHERLQRLLADPASRPAVLYPAAEAPGPDAWTEEPPRTLVVIDGTWTQARKVLSLNPCLRALPRISLRPARPGNYRIRREPAAHCLSTIEAVVEALGQLEGEPARFAPMLAAFDRMVDRQLACQQARVGPSRYKRLRARPRRGWRPEELSPERLSRLVLVHAEANAPALTDPVRFDPELVHLAALRPSTRERFEAFIAPGRPLSESTPRHLELPAERLLEGEELGAALARWRRFLGPEATLAAWGPFTRQLLAAAGAPDGPFLDLRQAATRVLGARPGGVHCAAARMSTGPVTAWASGRAGRRLAALEQVLDGLLFGDTAAMRARKVAPDGRG